MKRAYFIVIAVLALGLTAQAINLNVYCGGKRMPNTINAALKLLNPQVPNTLTVYGTCNENVLINGFNRLTLTTTTGATINDASGGTDFVVKVADSTDIDLQGLTINGGVLGVSCENFSVCRFEGNTIQGAAVAGIQLGQSRASFGANTIQNNGNGLVVLESSSVRTFGGLVIQQNQGQGVIVGTSGSFASFGDIIQNNAGAGVYADTNGSVLLLGTTVTGNLAHGVLAQAHVSVDFESGNVVAGNAADGVALMDLSFVRFASGNTITGNGWLDVDCEPQFSVARGLTNTGGGTTNCTEASSSQASGLSRPGLNRPLTPSD